jgi:DNA (cytosine-5)-methyltransferase 1
MLNAVELFAGAGGLGLGMSLAGFNPLAVVEWDKDACYTIRENQKREFPLIKDWPLHQDDVRAFNYESIVGPVDLVSGGPPCQPFSMGGKHRAFRDDRDMFPATSNIIRKLAPKAFIIENVKGLTRASFANYYNYILLLLEFPELIREGEEKWEQHLARLEKHKTSGSRSGLTYNVVPHLVNAANFGVPQKRERIFFVGFQHQLDVQWSFPEETHSYDALLAAQWINGEYWDKHRIAKKGRPEASESLQKRIEVLRKSNIGPDKYPWQTVRDALSDIPEPTKGNNFFLNHTLQEGARTYVGHTGSPLDLPAKALKAGDHGVPGGENMMVKDDGSVRYFTIRESARLQTFPDGYEFHGSWTEAMRQLGNAVPVALAQLVASSVAEKLLEWRWRQEVKARRAQ